MIKKSYNRHQQGYFYNFINANDPEANIEDKLKPYKATLGKTKAPNYKLNVKWHEKSLYVIFVLRWA